MNLTVAELGVLLLLLFGLFHYLGILAKTRAVLALLGAALEELRGRRRYGCRAAVLAERQRALDACTFVEPCVHGPAMRQAAYDRIKAGA